MQTIQAEEICGHCVPSPPRSVAASGAIPGGLRVVIAGNPNAGKTTLFNLLTHRNAKVGNYPGITVDRLTGHLELPGAGRIEITDVPGTYSLNARSRDEQLAIDELLGIGAGRRPDAAIVILDALTLERGLYFLMQVLEFEVPVVVAVNMMDSARAEGIQIDTDQLSQRFGVPFVPVVARRGQGIDALKKALDEALATAREVTFAPDWLWQPGPELARDLEALGQLGQTLVPGLDTPNRRRAYALWLLMSVGAASEHLEVNPALRDRTLELQASIKASGRDLDRETVLARYEVIDRWAPTFIRRPDRRTGRVTERIDSILTHPVTGSLVFLLIMTTIFQALFSWSQPLMDLIDGFFGWTAGLLTAHLPAGIARDLLTDGIIRGVGSVVVFLPQILFLFFFLTVLEGSGYMARAAFMIDRLMSVVGLHGRAFVPMISGYACAIPAIMAVRTIENQRDRLLTLMVIPLMSCSARLPVYALIIAAVFPAERSIGFISFGSLVLLAVYLLSTAAALLAASVLGRTALPGRRSPLLIELPPYRWPSARTIVRTLASRGRTFLMTAGRTILVISVLLWALLSFPRDASITARYDALRAAAGGDADRIAALHNEESADLLRHSYAGRLGTLIEPVIAPLGFDWKIGVGLIGAFAAREVFVSTLGVVYGVGDEADENSNGLHDAIRNDRRADGTPLWTPLTGLSLMVFFMFAMQCMSTLAVVRRETGSWKWTAFMLTYMSVLAYSASFLIYQGGRLAGLS